MTTGGGADASRVVSADRPPSRSVCASSCRGWASRARRKRARRRRVVSESFAITFPGHCGGASSRVPRPLRMRPRRTAAGLALLASAAGAQQPRDWPVHALDRPQPVVVRTASPRVVPPPSDAVVLFDGTSLAAWRSQEDTTKPARWRVTDGYLEVARGTGGIETRRAFGDVQLHVEWASPATPRGEGQERGNSGVFLMGRYEVQVLDSYGNRTYPDGQAAALYGQRPPLVNASRPPGEWQSYDIVFRRPRFDAAGALLAP